MPSGSNAALSAGIPLLTLCIQPLSLGTAGLQPARHFCVELRGS